MDAHGYRSLLERLASAWAARDPVVAAECFTQKAVYMEPPDRQVFIGQDELRAYFSPLEPGTYLTFRNVAFDESDSVGMVEFSFGVSERPTASHGVAVTQIEDGRISIWREYWRSGPSAWDEFISVEGKDWEWHIGNYP